MRDAGADLVILEKSVIEMCLGQKGEKPEAAWLVQLTERVGADFIVFEAEAVAHHAWLVKHFGLKIYQVLWEPLLAAKFGRHLKTVGMAWFWSRIYERPQKFGYFTGSFKTLTSALERRLNERGAVIHLSTAVAGLQPVGSQMAVITDSQREVFDKVIIAAPPEPFLRIAGPHLPCDFAERIAKLQYVGTVCAVLVLSRPFSEYYWLNINDSTSPFLALIEQTNFVAPEVYGGKHIVYLSRYIDPAEDFYRLPEDAIWDSFLPWVKKINPEFSENWILEKHLFRAPFTQPVIPPAYGKIRPPYKTPLASLWWVSMSHIYPWDRGTDHSFHAGRELVREMLEGARAV